MWLTSFLWIYFQLVSRGVVLALDRWPQFQHIQNSTWNSVKEDLRCLTSTGSWQLNSTIQIIDNIYLYAPCPLYYGPKNQCAWTLDGNQLKYYWEPEQGKCSQKLVHFEANAMCSMMEDVGNILVVGDSVSQLSVLSWQNKFLSQMNTTCPKNNTNVEHPIPNCGSDFRLLFMRNDFLSNVTESRITESDHENPWLYNISHHNVSLLILNRGAHYTDDDALLTGVNSTLHHLSVHHPHVSIIWRNTPHGARDWQSYALGAPLTSPPKLDFDSSPYNYGRFQHQNALVEKLIEENFPRVLYLDVFTSTVLRADSHYDALHLCVPGVMDVWLQFVYNALRLIAEKHTLFQREHALPRVRQRRQRRRLLG